MSEKKDIKGNDNQKETKRRLRVGHNMTALNLQLKGIAFAKWDPMKTDPLTAKEVGL